MRPKDQNSLYIQSPKLNELNVLREVANNACITQAELARCCSLSVAMVNNYMKDLCSREFIEYNRKSIKSISYHLTPAGRRHLETLQIKLIDEMVQMFVCAKGLIMKHIMGKAGSALQRVALYGTGPLAELVFHALELSGVIVLSVCDDNPKMIGRDFCGREVVNSSKIRYYAPDAVIVADTLRADEIFGNLKALMQRGIEIIRIDGRKETGVEILNSDAMFLGNRDDLSESFTEPVSTHPLS